eukprot:jgi/Botrbrau1/11107/Bobra.0219s0016.1
MGRAFFSLLDFADDAPISASFRPRGPHGPPSCSPNGSSAFTAVLFARKTGCRDCSQLQQKTLKKLMINFFSILENRWFCHIRVCWFGLIQTFPVRFCSRGYRFCFSNSQLHLSEQCHSSCGIRMQSQRGEKRKRVLH